MRKQNGITLIALVITIIILIILAGVTITLLVDDNGILTQATHAVSKTRIAQAKEEMSLAWASIESQYWTDLARNSNISKSEYFTEENFEKYLPDGSKVSNFKYNEEDETTSLIYESNEHLEYVIEIDNTGKVGSKTAYFANKVTAANYGDKVNYKSKNGIEEWQIFYKNAETNNVFLISKDYIPFSKIPKNIGMEQGIGRRKHCILD